MENNLEIQLIHMQQNALLPSKSLTNVKHIATTADVRKPNTVLPEYDAPKISRQPTGHQHVRMFSELTSGICPLIQAGGKDASQQTYVEIEVSNSIFRLKDELL
jgi:hypothetical protein